MGDIVDDEFIDAIGSRLALIKSHADLVRQRDVYQQCTFDAEAKLMAANDKIAELERQLSVMTARCCEQDRAIERMLYRRSRVVHVQPAEPHPAIRAIEAMQKQGIR